MPATCQSVVSTRAGLVHYFEGVVAIDGAPLQAQFGRFPEIAEGAELRTGQGRAEVLLGPGAILRVAEDSALKMVSSKLADVRLELTAGTAILEMKDPLPGNSVTLRYKQWQVHIPSKGVYRIDSRPERIRAYDGEVEVSADGSVPVRVKAGQTLPLGAVLAPDQTLGAPGDEFNDWAFERSQSIAADNATAAQIVDDPALYPNLIDASGLSLAGYTYFPPTLGYPYLGYQGVYGPGAYGAWSPYAVGLGGLGYGFGYGYARGPGFGPASVYSFQGGYPGLGTRITPRPGIPVHAPLGGGYHPPTLSFPTSRPGVMSPSFPRAAPPAGAAGGAHPVGHVGRR